MKRWRTAFAALLLIVIGVAGTAASWLWRPLPLASDSVELAIEPGTSPRSIAQGWVAAGVRTSPTLLYQWFRWSRQDRKIRAGNYQIERGTTPIKLLSKMVRGDETLAYLRLIDGWNFRQLRAELAKTEGLKLTTAGMSDAQVMASIGAAGVPAEGRFYPDSYAFSKGSTDVALLRRAYRAMQMRLAAAWAERAADVPLRSADEALTLASIVEKETGIAADRAKVSAVFSNRLRLGMPLQTDPTVIYGIGDAFDGNLRRSDLAADTPYNTYLRTGLPPTPIAMPGKASLRAAIRPDPSDALYFVARGDGSSQFSRSLEEHNRAVNQYQRAPVQGRPP